MHRDLQKCSIFVTSFFFAWREDLGLYSSRSHLQRWFSSVAGPTLPNRAFAHYGTSFGRLDMSPVYFSRNPSTYQRLRQAGAQSKIYCYSNASGTMGLTFLLNDQYDYFGLWGDFENDCKNDSLPHYLTGEISCMNSAKFLETD